MNTAGLGGVGGPYRLDAGHTVYQVSDFDKSQVPEEVTALFLHTLTLSPPSPLSLYTLRYLSNPPFLIFDILALW